MKTVFQLSFILILLGLISNIILIFDLSSFIHNIKIIVLFTLIAHALNTFGLLLFVISASRPTVEFYSKKEEIDITLDAERNETNI